MGKKYGVIVDGYSTGAGLAKEFMKHGIDCIHVQSQPIIPFVYQHTFAPKDYHANYVFTGDIELLTKHLQEFFPKFVLVGAECGVNLADQLAETLNLAGNGTLLSGCRRDKDLMVRQAAKFNIQVIPSFSSSDINAILTWAEKQNYWPLVVKPINSAGGEGVKICHSLDEIYQAYVAIMNRDYNMLGFKNNGVLIQNYIVGKEYVINTVSYDGNHKLCEIWQYTRYMRPGGIQIYDTAEILAYNADEHLSILEYSKEILNALGIKFGPAHVEIIVNEAGCFLVELGARLMGANLPFDLLSQCISTPQALMTVLAYTDPQKFISNIDEPYKVLQFLMAIFMVSDKHGVIHQINNLNDIKSLASFFDMKLAVNIGQNLFETIDYKTSPGMIYLSSSLHAIIDADKKYIRTLEKKMFYVT